MNILFSFSKMGFPVENFIRDGNISEAKDRLHIYAKRARIVLAHIFNILVRISSYPKPLEQFKNFIIFFF